MNDVFHYQLQLGGQVVDSLASECAYSGGVEMERGLGDQLIGVFNLHRYTIVTLCNVGHLSG